VADCCECGDEPSGSCATELVSYCNLKTFKAQFLRLDRPSSLGKKGSQLFCWLGSIVSSRVGASPFYLNRKEAPIYET
jgi:hypothetical protein